MIITNQTPFYGESGGQLGDKGTIVSGNSVFEVEDTQKKLDKALKRNLEKQIQKVENKPPVEEISEEAAK